MTFTVADASQAIINSRSSVSLTDIINVVNEPYKFNVLATIDAYRSGIYSQSTTVGLCPVCSSVYR